MIRVSKFNTFGDNPDKGFPDRGFISSIYNANENGAKYVEDRISYSRKGVLRGLHGDNQIGKLFIPIKGVFKFYAKGLLNDDSVFFDSWSHESGLAIYVPPNYINGHLCMSDEAIMMYKWTHNYNGPEHQFTVKYDDPDLGIDWGLDALPIVSRRDANGMSYKELKKQYENRVW